MKSSYVSPKQSAYCPECKICPQQERTNNRGERLCSNGHVFTLRESKESRMKNYQKKRKEQQ